MKTWLLRLYRDQRAVTSIEYALLAALIAVIIVGAVTNVGSQVAQLYGGVKDQISLAIK